MAGILIATFNRGKIREIMDVLAGEFAGTGFYSPVDFDISVSPVEDGNSFFSNSIIKSVYFSSKVKGILTMADDSGLSVNSLNGSPGIRSARFAGEDSDDRKNIDKLLSELKNISDRSATFISVITLSMNGEVIRSFRGEVSGEIIDDPRGHNGFGYDPVFYYKPLKKTFAELSAGEKNNISHRAEALKKMKEFLLHNRDLIK